MVSKGRSLTRSPPNGSTSRSLATEGRGRHRNGSAERFRGSPALDAMGATTSRWMLMSVLKYTPTNVPPPDGPAVEGGIDSEGNPDRSQSEGERGIAPTVDRCLPHDEPTEGTPSGQGRPGECERGERPLP